MYKPTNVSEELLPVVNEQDEVIGTEKRGIIHAKKLLHRAVHVLLFNPEGNIYIQQRSLIKDSAPGKWDSSSSGHVDPDETYAQASVREVREELNISVISLKEVGKLPARSGTGMEFSMIYTGVTDQEPAPNPHEIMSGRWIETDALDRWIDKDPGAFAGCFLAVWKFLKKI
jgi:isopentenyldiphosphate isomerase